MKLFEIHVHHHHGPGETALLAIKRKLEMLSPQIQELLDKARKNQNLVTAIDLSQKALQQQVKDLQAKIDSLPVGDVLTAEDKAGITEAVGDLDQSITTLTADTTANTPQQGTNPTDAGSQTGQPATPQVQADQAKSSQDGATGGEGQPASTDGPKPLPGTGQS